MKVVRAFLLTGLLAAACAGAPALALGPVDVELGVDYWQNDLELSSDEGSDEDGGDAVGYHAAFWITRFGLRVSQYESDTDNLASVKFQSADVMYRLFKLTENNRLSVGAGLERMKFETGLGSDTADGPRVAVEGRVGLFHLLYGYGEAAYYPSLSDVEIAGTTLQDPSGYEYELGLAIHPWPFLWLKAGYRQQSVSVDFAGGGSGDIEAEGWLAGATFKF